MRAANAATFSDDFVIPTTKMCDNVSYEEEKKNYRSECMRRLREAVR